MAVEMRRGCGYRKVGGLYLRADGQGMACGRLPIPLSICPTCGGGIKQTRGWTWMAPSVLFAGLDMESDCTTGNCSACPLGSFVMLGEKAGLLWIGEQHYATPEAFDAEAAAQGISRRIAGVPNDFEVGKTFVLLAHPVAVPEDGGTYSPGVFRIIRPHAVEIIITDEQLMNAEFMASIEKRGLTPVVVLHDDLDHQ